MNILLTLLNEKLQDLLHAETEITESKTETLLTYANPYGGKPLQVLYRPGEDFKVTLNKTPRYYQQDSTIPPNVCWPMWPVTRKEKPFPWTARTTTEPKADRTVSSTLPTWKA